jgi:hypothetical protein
VVTLRSRSAFATRTWSASAWLEDVVRSVTSARIDARAPLGIEVTLAHAIYRTRRGESLYLAESESEPTGAAGR